MKVKFHLALTAMAALATVGSASAATTTLTGNSVKVTITDKGVFNSLIYDPTATGNFIPSTDYVAPGIPFEGFEVIANGSRYANSNSGGTDIIGTTAVSGGADNSATWSGTVGGLFTLTHQFFFNDADQRVNITTTIQALADLTDVRVSRAVDPDPDNYPGGTAATNNQRGIASPSVPVSDFVGSIGQISGRPLGLFYSGPLTHNTGIVSSCCSVTDPNAYLAGGDLGDSSSGDNGIGLAFALGDLLSGSSLTWSYAYVMGGSLGTIDIPTEPSAVPEPATLLLLGTGLLAARARRKKQ